MGRVAPSLLEVQVRVVLNDSDDWDLHRPVQSNFLHFHPKSNLSPWKVFFRCEICFRQLMRDSSSPWKRGRWPLCHVARSTATSSNNRCVVRAARQARCPRCYYYNVICFFFWCVWYMVLLFFLYFVFATLKVHDLHFKTTEPEAWETRHLETTWNKTASFAFV